MADTPPPDRQDPVKSPLLDLGAFHRLRDVEVEVALEIGRRRMRIADVLRLGTGQTIELAKAAGEPIDIYVNGRLIGRGEAVVVSERYGVRITELVATEEKS
jgi:flagellar motor switch protein FliN/FliY